jgi:hypothetical protein
VFAAEHLLGLPRVDFAREVLEALGEIVANRFAGLRPLHEHGEIVGATPKRVAEVLIVLEPSAALQEFLRGGLIFPEVGSGDPLLYAGQFL